MLRAAQRFGRLDSVRSRECNLDAVELSLAVGRACGVLTGIVTEARCNAPPAPRGPDLLDALGALHTGGPRAAAPLWRGVLGGSHDPMWARRPATSTMIAEKLSRPELNQMPIPAYDIDLHVRP